MEDIDISDNEIEILAEEIEDNESEKYIKDKTSAPIMSIYEKIKVLNMRVLQLNSNYKSKIENMIKEKNITKSIDIAVLEFDTGNLPKYYIKRKFPNGNYELWSHEDFLYFPQ
jgi:DNA-directed RNA polymerase subunit K/omega